MTAISSVSLTLFVLSAVSPFTQTWETESRSESALP
jgi:hypothetical protein